MERIHESCRLEENTKRKLGMLTKEYLYWYLLRYLFEITVASTLCMTESVAGLARTILETWEYTIVLEYHDNYRSLS